MSKEIKSLGKVIENYIKVMFNFERYLKNRQKEWRHNKAICEYDILDSNEIEQRTLCIEILDFISNFVKNKDVKYFMSRLYESEKESKDEKSLKKGSMYHINHINLLTDSEIFSSKCNNKNEISSTKRPSKMEITPITRQSKFDITTSNRQSKIDINLSNRKSQIYIAPSNRKSQIETNSTRLVQTPVNARNTLNPLSYDLLINSTKSIQPSPKSFNRTETNKSNFVLSRCSTFLNEYKNDHEITQSTNCINDATKNKNSLNYN